jgi:uncharacterized protein (UPF0332 family)
MLRRPPIRHGRTEHIENAKHHRSLAAVIDQERDRYRDWLVTAHFYVVIHLVEAWMATKGIHNRGHRQRLIAIGDQLGARWETSYDRLLGRARSYRYECQEPTEAELARLLDDEVRPFVEHLAPRLYGERGARILIDELRP